MSSPWYQWDGDDLVLRLHVQPGAQRDEWVGPHGDRLKIRISAPPVDGKANLHLCRFLASLFAVAKSAVQVEAGPSGREKHVRIQSPEILPPGIGRAL